MRGVITSIKTWVQRQNFINKSKEILLYCEHVDFIWINEVWGGVNIGPNSPTGWRSEMGANVDPIYLGIDRVKPGSCLLYTSDAADE